MHFYAAVAVLIRRSPLAFDRDYGRISVFMGLIVAIIDVIQLVIVFSSNNNITVATIFQLVMFVITILIWFRHICGPYPKVISSTLLFLIAQLIIEMIKHIVVVELNAQLDGHDCFIL